MRPIRLICLYLHFVAVYSHSGHRGTRKRRSHHFCHEQRLGSVWFGLLVTDLGSEPGSRDDLYVEKLRCFRLGRALPQWPFVQEHGTT